MKKKDFDNLVDSVREAGRIRRGEAKASRVTEYLPVDVKAIRTRLAFFAHRVSAALRG
jgi:putative transcriptional regulator